MDFILVNSEKEVIYQEHCVHCVIFFKTLNFSCVENTGGSPQLLRPLTVNRFACMQAYVRFLLTTPFPHTVLYCTIGSFMSGWVSEWVSEWGREGGEGVSEWVQVFFRARCSFFDRPWASKKVSWSNYP